MDSFKVLSIFLKAGQTKWHATLLLDLPCNLWAVKLGNTLNNNTIKWATGWKIFSNSSPGNKLTGVINTTNMLPCQWPCETPGVSLPQWSVFTAADLGVWTVATAKTWPQLETLAPAPPVILVWQASFSLATGDWPNFQVGKCAVSYNRQLAKQNPE